MTACGVLLCCVYMMRAEYNLLVQLATLGEPAAG